MKDRAVKVLEQLIQCYENDMQIIDDANAKEDMLQMIIKLTSWIHGIRYCSNKDCMCSPEKGIKYILERNGDLFKNPLYLFPVHWKVLYEIAGMEVKTK